MLQVYAHCQCGDMHACIMHVALVLIYRAAHYFRLLMSLMVCSRGSHCGDVVIIAVSCCKYLKKNVTIPFHIASELRYENQFF
jgi:hypothetical protein